MNSIDVATGKMRSKMRINIRILLAHPPSVTGILKPLTFHGVICTDVIKKLVGWFVIKTFSRSR